MRSTLLAAMASVSTLAAAAQQPLQCVNPDILNGLVFSGQLAQKVDATRSLPAFMGDFRAPADFTLIGSAVRGGGDYTTVAYRTALTSDKAYAAFVASLNARGWHVEPEPGSVQTFQLSNGPRNGTVCRDGERRTVMVSDATTNRYVNLLVPMWQIPRGCNTPDPAMRMMFGESSPAPRFTFPAGTGRAAGGGGGGGSNTFQDSSTRIISTESPAGLVKLLAGQIREQGWVPDADWSGDGSAGSTWRKTIDGRFTWGVLEIEPVSENTYDVRFTLATVQ